MNAAAMPNTPANTPPAAAPTASMVDHVAELRALAGPSSRREAISGRIATRTGKNTPLIPTCTPVSTNSSHTWCGSRTSSRPSTTTARSRSVTIRMRLRL